MWRYSWPDGEQVYVSQSSGEVAQYTTRASRMGAYVGAIPHWLYVTPLRRHGPLWSRIVITLSGLATAVAALGLTIGVWTFSPTRRYRRAGVPVRLPYRNWKRWHAILGLIVGIGALTWAFSGMLSMDPFPLPGEPPQTGEVEQALRGTIQRSAFEGLTPHAALAPLGTARVKQLEFISSSDQSFAVATLDSGETRIVTLSGATRTSFDAQQITNLVGAAVRPTAVTETRLLDEYRSLLSRSAPQASASGCPRPPGRSRCDAVLHRSENRAAGRRLQRQKLGDPLAVSRASLAGLPVALSLSTFVGRHCRRVHGGWNGVVLHVARPRLAGDRPNAQPSGGAR